MITRLQNVLLLSPALVPQISIRPCGLKLSSAKLKEHEELSSVSRQKLPEQGTEQKNEILRG